MRETQRVKQGCGEGNKTLVKQGWHEAQPVDQKVGICSTGCAAAALSSSA